MVVDIAFTGAMKVVIAEVVWIKGAVRCDFSGQTAFIQWYTHDDTDIVFLAGWQQVVLRTLIKDVINDLHRID
jgi:hypothetical protein